MKNCIHSCPTQNLQSTRLKEVHRDSEYLRFGVDFALGQIGQVEI